MSVSKGCRSLPALLAAVILAAGCGTLQGGRGWGQDAIWPVSGRRVARAARDAFLSPNTLIPLAAAAVFAIDDFDERVSVWAVKHTPLYGSPSGARDASEELKAVLKWEALATALATSSGSDPNQWALSKLKGISVELVAVGVTNNTTSLLKNVVDRDRPDLSNKDSFPSGTTSSAFSYATVANRNLDSIDIPGGARTAFKTANALVGSAVAWARVEGGVHYPSDVLVGAAVGHFMTAFIHDAFMNLPENGSVDFAVVPLKGGAAVMVTRRF